MGLAEKKSSKKCKKKAAKNNSSKTMKLIGFDLPKKLANIISFVIFAV